MNRCEHISRQALALASLGPLSPEMNETREHARSCSVCSQALREGERMLAVLDGALATPPPSDSVLRRIRVRILDRMAASPAAGPIALAALTVSALFAVLTAATPGIFPLTGLRCLGFELLSAVWPIAAVVAFRGLPSVTRSFHAAALAAAGALAGQAALHFSCPVSTAGPHLMLFHFGGVALAALAGWAIPRVARAA